MTGDPFFSRSGRRNFKDLHEGQKHSLGPLIITTGVPLSGARPLLVQNCAAGVPRVEPPLTSSCISSSIDPQNIFFSLARARNVGPDLFARLLIFSFVRGAASAARWEQAVAIIESQRCSLIPEEKRIERTSQLIARSAVEQVRKGCELLLLLLLVKARYSTTWKRTDCISSSHLLARELEFRVTPSWYLNVTFLVRLVSRKKDLLDPGALRKSSFLVTRRS